MTYWDGEKKVLLYNYILPLKRKKERQKNVNLNLYKQKLTQALK